MAKSKAKEKKAVSEPSFDFSDIFDDIETSSKIQAIEVRERLDTSIAISSGSLLMDLVLLHGGYYPGRAYDLVGPESGGKCILGDSLVPTPKGIFKIKDLVGEDVDGLTEKQVEIYTRNGVRSTSHVYAKESVTKKIIFANGNILEGTPEHPVLIFRDGMFNDESNYNWRKLEDLQPGDIVFSIFNRHDYFTKNNATYDYSSKLIYSNTMNCGLATFLGFLSTSEGIEAINNATTVAQVYNYFKYQHFTAFQNELKIEIRKGTDTEILEDLKGLVKYLGLDLDKEQVQVPWSILQSDISTVTSYINGFMRFSSHPNVYGCGFKCSNVTIARQIQNLLYLRGTVSVVSSDDEDSQYYIKIPFIQSGFSSTNEFTYNYGKVVKVEDGETQKVYDLTVPVEHEFIANNLVVHNTTSGNSVLGEALSFVPKYSVGQYYDFEGSLDTTWFMNIAGRPNDNPETIFGKRDKQGNWIIKPRIRLYKPTFGEQGLIQMTKTLNSLPDKGMFRDEWWYTWTPVDAKVKKKTGGLTAKDIEDMLKQRGIQWDKDFLKKNKLYGVRVPDNYGGCEGIMFNDSWAAMTPRQTAEDDSAAMAQQGRMFSKYINQVKTLISNKGWICIGVNQIRQNPNTRFGSCFKYNTRVLLEDGSTELIGRIVNQERFDKRVICYNLEKRCFEKKRIIRGFRTPVLSSDRVVKVTYNHYTKGCRPQASFIATDNHVVFTPNGERQLKDLKPGDFLLKRDTTTNLSSDQHQVLYGCMLGDSEVNINRNSFFLKINHVDYQKKYLLWKLGLLGQSSDISYFEYNTKDKKHRLYSGNTLPISITKIPPSFRCKKRSQEEVNQKFISKLDIRAIAVWYMDDGDAYANPRDGWRLSIACSRFTDDSKERLRIRLNEIFGTSFKIDAKGFCVKTKDEVISVIRQLSPYIHPCMKYKLIGLVEYNKIGTYKWKAAEIVDRITKVEILSIEEIDNNKMRGSKYDIEIEGNHNYIIGGPNGVLVHNSEYQPGGEALKHFCDCRNRFGSVNAPAGGAIEVENNGQDEYRYFKVRNKKNKISTPYGEIEGRFWTKREGKTGCGIDPVLDTIKYLEQTGQIEKTRKGFRIALNDNSKASGKLNDIIFSYNDFKNLILNNVVDTGKKTANFNLRNHCKKQIKSGKAFELYYKAGGANDNQENNNEGEEDE